MREISAELRCVSISDWLQIVPISYTPAQTHSEPTYDTYDRSHNQDYNLNTHLRISKYDIVEISRHYFPFESVWSTTNLASPHLQSSQLNPFHECVWGGGLWRRCVWVCGHMHVYELMCGGQSTTLRVISQVLSRTFLFETRTLIGLELLQAG